MIPCGVEPIGKEAVPSLRVSSFPHIAGIIVVSAQTLKISSTNAVFSAALLGQVNPVGLHINEIIPDFERIVSYLLQEEHMNPEDGLVVPEHSFRKANAVLAIREGKHDGFSIISRPGGLAALHRDGSEIFVDLQMRVVVSESRNSEVFTDAPDKSELMYALWVTYSRHLHIASCAHASQQPVWTPETPPQGPISGQSDPQLSPKSEKSESSSMSAASDPTVNVVQEASKHPTPPSSDDENSFSLHASAKPPMPRISTAPAAMSKRQKVIQDFTILEDMGEGAYGQVKLARYKRNSSKRVVLKYVTKKRILVDTWTRDRRLGTVPLEIHVLDYLRRDGLQHPNIVEMTDFFEDDINYYIEMVPHGLPGMDLFDYIELKVNMDEEECRSIFVQVARALHHLHTRAGVCHRDIKDENVILDGQGNIKLIDFGSATYVKNGPFSVFVGTIGECH